MPKRNTLPSLPDYTGDVKNPEKLLIQKSNPLQSLSQTSMTLPELKILDAYLARINSHEPEKRYVQFKKGELEKLLNVTRILKKDLDARINNLFQTITIQDETKRNGFTKIALFEKAECEQDENGLWQVNLMCTNSAMEYIFNIENLGYLKYRLKNVVNLTSRYSYILYLCLEDNQKFKGSRKWLVDLDELKKILNCTAETYSQFKEFNKQVLKKCQKEINEKTTLKFIYTPVKKGRKVVAVEFDIKKSQEIEIVDKNPEPKELPVVSAYIDKPQTPEQYPEYEPPLSAGAVRQASYNQSEPKAENTYSDDYHSFIAIACDCEFTENQIDDILSMINTMPWIQYDYRLSGGDWKFAFHHYIKEVYARLNVYADTHEVRDRYALFRKFVDNDRKKGLSQYED